MHLKRKPKLSDWQSLMNFAYYSLKIRQHLLECTAQLPTRMAEVGIHLKPCIFYVIQSQIVAAFDPESLRELGTHINTMVLNSFHAV